MIYLVSQQEELFETDLYQRLSTKDSLELIREFSRVQYDSETNGRDARLCKVLSAQFGNDAFDARIVVDTSTVDLLKYKPVLEDKLIIGHNLKFDTQFLFNYGIVPNQCFDTMIIEQLLHLGFDNTLFHYSLHDVLLRYLGIDLDKSIRGEIIWRGLDPAVVKYAAGDVMYLEQLMDKEMEEVNKTHCSLGAKIENMFVPVIAYLEWCGIKLDLKTWMKKMAQDQANLDKSLQALNHWIIGKAKDNAYFMKYTNDDPCDLFRDQFETQATINWSSANQVVELCKQLGFNTRTEDKKTGQSKDSVVEKLLSKQKGICDEFLDLYFKYQEASKVCSTYGQNYIDAINPVTGRIHTSFKQLGASSGRMSCGSKQKNTDLAKFKHCSEKKCGYMQLQNLPADELTRASFVSEPGNLMTSCDYSALESRLGADIYNEPEMLREFLEGSGDMHSLCAKIVFHEELKDIDVKDIKKQRPDLRKKVKPIEFSQQFGGGAKAVADALGCDMKEARKFVDAYASGFAGISEFKDKGSKFVRTHGYVIICKYTGHKMYWEDWNKWRAMEDTDEWLLKREYSSEEIREHNMAGAKWDRMALNAPTQGTGIIILKTAMTMFFRWICKHDLFGKVLICDLVHDEAVIEYPEELKDIVVAKLKECMEKAAQVFCKKLPIPAEPETGTHWIH